MEKMDLAFTGPTRFQPAEPAPNKAGRLVWLIVGSVLIHIAVLATLSFPPPVTKPVKISPIQAVLYTPVVPAPTQAEAAELPEPAVADVALKAPEKAESQAENQPSQTEPATPPAQAEEIFDVSTEASAPPSGEILTQAEDSPAPPSRRLSNAIRRGIAGQQLQKQYDLAEEVSRQRREEHISPDLKIGEYEPPEPKIGEYKINCEKGINSTLAIVAGVLGGNVKCNQRNEFQQFIDKRQHKPTQ